MNAILGTLSDLEMEIGPKRWEGGCGGTVYRVALVSRKDAELVDGVRDAMKVLRAPLHLSSPRNEPSLAIPSTVH